MKLDIQFNIWGNLSWKVVVVVVQTWQIFFTFKIPSGNKCSRCFDQTKNAAYAAYAINQEAVDLTKINTLKYMLRRCWVDTNCTREKENIIFIIDYDSISHNLSQVFFFFNIIQFYWRQITIDFHPSNTKLKGWKIEHSYIVSWIGFVNSAKFCQNYSQLWTIPWILKRRKVKAINFLFHEVLVIL